MVVPVDAEGRVNMVNQFRYLGNRESLEFPSGGVEQGDSFLHTEAQSLHVQRVECPTPPSTKATSVEPKMILDRYAR